MHVCVYVCISVNFLIISYIFEKGKSYIVWNVLDRLNEKNLKE